MDGFKSPEWSSLLPSAEDAAQVSVYFSWPVQQAAVLDMISEGVSMSEVLAHIAAGLRTCSGDAFVTGVFMVQPSGQHLSAEGGTTLPYSLCEAMLSLPFNDQEMMSSGGYMVISAKSNMALWSYLETSATALRLETCLLFPVASGNKHIAAYVNVWMKEGQALTDATLSLIKLAVSTTRIAIMHRHTEDRRVQLQERERIAREQVSLAENVSQLAADGAGAGTFHVNLTDNYIVYSPLLSIIMTGKYIPGLTRKVLSDYVHPADRHIREKAYKEAAETGQLKYETRFVWEDGSVHWVKVLGKYLPDAEGKISHFAGIALDITHEAKAREEQLRLISLIDSSSDFMAMGDNSGSPLYINPAGRKLVGIAPEDDLSGYSNKDFYPEDMFVTINAKVLPELLANDRWSGPLRLQHLVTRQVIPCHAELVTIRDPLTKEVIGRGSTIRDLRPEILARIALQESEERFRLLIERSPVAIGVVKGEDLIIDVANEALIELWGKQKEVLRLPLIELLPELKDQPFPGLMHEVMRTGKAYYGIETLAHLNRHGQIEARYFNFVYAPYREGDAITGVQMIATDVTTQVEAKKNLVASEERFRDLVYGAPVPIAIYTGSEMRVLIANDSVLSTWGRDATVIGKTFLEALPELEGTPWLGKLQEVYHTGIPFEAKEQRVDLQIDGKLQLHYFNFTYKPLYDGKGKIYGVINTASDVTSLVLARQQSKNTEQVLEKLVSQRTEELSRANQQLTQSNEELEQFAYVASHDLQEPLRKIRIFSDLLQGQLQDQASADNALVYLEKVRNSAERMSNLILDLLNFSRITKKQELLEPVSLNKVLARVTIDFELLIRQKQASIDIKDLPVIEAIPLQMNQLFYNLVGNALKFTHPDRLPDIRISSRPATAAETLEHLNHSSPEGYVLIRVEDNGIGFEPEMSGQIFTIFQRLHTRFQFEGTGIGLALCKRIVLAHGGAIWATGKLHEGASFSILLPLQQRS